MNQSFSKILIIVVLAAISAGGVFVWQYFLSPEQEKEPVSVGETGETATTEEMLKQMFPGYRIENGVIGEPGSGKDTISVMVGEGGFGLSQIVENLNLVQIIDGSFTVPSVKEKLLVVEGSGRTHAAGYYHAFLGFFDKNGNLINQKHFGRGDKGYFAFYKCNDGITYIFLTEERYISSAPPGTSEVQTELLRVDKNGQFQVIQNVAALLGGDGTITKQEGESMLKVYERNKKSYSGEDIYLGSLDWDDSTCRFEKI